jgi:hypothetical protein
MLLYTTKHFGNWIRFHLQMEGWETPTLLGPLEKENLKHWTLWSLEYQTIGEDQVLSNPECYPTWLESFRRWPRPVLLAHQADLHLRYLIVLQIRIMLGSYSSCHFTLPMCGLSCRMPPPPPLYVVNVIERTVGKTF